MSSESRSTRPSAKMTSSGLRSLNSRLSLHHELIREQLGPGSRQLIRRLLEQQRQPGQPRARLEVIEQLLERHHRVAVLHQQLAKRLPRVEVHMRLVEDAARRVTEAAGEQLQPQVPERHI